MINDFLINNLRYTALLSIDSGKSTGSGFFIQIENEDFLITARHVLFSNSSLRGNQLIVTSQNFDDTINGIEWYEVNLESGLIIQDGDNDIAIIKFGNISENRLESNITSNGTGGIKPYGIKQTYIKQLENLGIANSVYLIGFPTSLFSSEKLFDSTKPLVRKGIISGINIQSNTFIIDASSYYGNSGGPVIELSQEGQLNLIGFASRYIPFTTEWHNNRESSITHIEISNSGYSVCVPMDRILTMISNICQ